MATSSYADSGCCFDQVAGIKCQSKLLTKSQPEQAVKQKPYNSHELRSREVFQQQLWFVCFAV